MSCCRGKATTPTTSSTTGNSAYATALKLAKEGMFIDDVIKQILPYAPVHTARALKARIIRELSRMGFKVTPAGRLMKK